MIVPLLVFAVALLMIAFEIVRPGRSFPQVAGWWVRAFLLNVLQVVVIYLSGIAWDKWFYDYKLWSGEALGITIGAVLGYLLITFVFYWWHRWRHESYFLWRWFHQVHHSPQRIEIITAFYKHPFELVADSVISSFLLYVVLGLTPQAASYAILLSGLGELFYHWNVETPYWLGFIFQRPESHCVHHQVNVHHYNYSDLPLWDMLFGTFYNPKKFEEQCGFGDKEHKLTAMLKGVDVNKKKPISDLCD